MAMMGPAVIRPKTPPGQVKVFEATPPPPGTGGRLVWHDLPIGHHETQVEGEADFVIVVPGEGMLMVEVKSHERVEVDDRGWRLGGGEPPFVGSPATVVDELERWREESVPTGSTSRRPRVPPS